jgi:hypothetical protein
MALVSYICGFCGAEIEPQDIALSIAISGLGVEDGATQGIVAHGVCLADRLHPSVPFLAEAFAD